LARSAGRLGSLVPDLAADLPVDGVAIVDSPSDPLGMLLRPVDAVRVARACQLLIVDERYVEYAGQSLLSFAAEFDNIVVCRSFDAWAGLLDAPCGWAVVPRGLNERLGAALALPRPEAIVAALATLDWMTSVDMTMRLVRDERSRLYRLLRKFSLLEPLPSWGPFLTARVAIGSRDDVVTGLDRRGIVVHAPEEAGLENYIRFGIGTRTSMERLRGALLDLAPEILADSLEARRADSDGLALSGEELIQAEAGEVE
jgi:histidinol-phosphate aminotransferase